MNFRGRISVMTEIKKGDLVWILANPQTDPHKMTLRGVVLNTIDGGWCRVFSSYWTSAGERTSIKDFPESMLKRIYYQ